MSTLEIPPLALLLTQMRNTPAATARPAEYGQLLAALLTGHPSNIRLALEAYRLGVAKYLLGTRIREVEQHFLLDLAASLDPTAASHLTPENAVLTRIESTLRTYLRATRG